MNRRDALKWMAAAIGTVSFLDAAPRSLGSGQKGGYGTDPDLLKGAVPWSRTLNDRQLKLTAALADLILPRAGGNSPSASELKVPDFIDEWISAPYPDQQRDRATVLEGLEWMDAEAARRFERDFVALSATEAIAICDDICFPPAAAPKYARAARFFSTFRNLCLGGYYTTDVGMRDAGYVGNIPLPAFNGPPPEVLKRLGIERAPW